MADKDKLQPTLIYGGATPTPADSEGGSASRARVGFVEGSAPRFGDEIADVLRQRLRVITAIAVVVLSLALIPTLYYPLLWLRIGMCLTLAGMFALLSSPRPLSHQALRAIDFFNLATLVVVPMIMSSTLILKSARAGNFSGAVMEQYFIYSVFTLTVMVYGLLIPNTWQRALAIVLPVSLVPFVCFFFLGRYEPLVRQALASPDHATPFPTPIVAAFTSVFCAHVIHGMRRAVFKAQQFGQYRLKQKLGAGGMGEVFQAEHELLKRPCAIKLIRPGVDAEFDAIGRFAREVQATAKLSHWNTVEIYDYGRTDDGVFYYVMELLPGLSLMDLLEKHGPLPPGRAVYLLRQVCAALQEAHGMGLIHRDLKPANIFAARRGGLDDVAKLLDFGLVKQGGVNSGDSQLTQHGVISGSPPYMSPEQASTDLDVDTRSDIYSLGAVAYCLVTGRPPFDGKGPLDFIIAHARDPVVPPSVRQADLPLDLEKVILRCLAKKPDERYQEARELAADLAGCACANDWNADLAAEWWRTHPTPELDERLDARDQPTLPAVTPPS